MPTTASSFIDLPLELVHAILRHAALSGVESSQLRWTASLCLVSASVNHLVRPILYHTLVITLQNRDKFEQIAASTNRQWLRDVRRVFLLGAYRSYAPMPDALFAAFDPSAISAISAQFVVYRQFCPSESPACAFRPREVHFRDALLEYQLEDAAALAVAAPILGMFPLIAPTQGREKPLRAGRSHPVATLSLPSSPSIISYANYTSVCARVRAFEKIQFAHGARVRVSSMQAFDGSLSRVSRACDRDPGAAINGRGTIIGSTRLNARRSTARATRGSTSATLDGHADPKLAIVKTARNPGSSTARGKFLRARKLRLAIRTSTDSTAARAQ